MRSMCPYALRVCRPSGSGLGTNNSGVSHAPESEANSALPSYVATKVIYQSLSTCGLVAKDPFFLYMIDYWLWDVVDCMRHEEEKIPGMNTTYT